MSDKKTLVISAVNIVEAGTLAILRACLVEASKLSGWDVIVLVHSKALFEINNITFIELPHIKSSWFKRIKFEYFDCMFYARKLRPNFWLSMHDMTPNLGKLSSSVRQAVYCHNAMCFQRLSLQQAFFEPKLILFSFLYKFFYRLFIKRNSFVVVQQEWLRMRFETDFGLSSRVLVLPPYSSRSSKSVPKTSGRKFICVSYPRSFKNFETLLDAWEILKNDPDFIGELVVTISPEQNRYSKFLVDKYRHLKDVSFVGILSVGEIQKLYENSDCLVFPSLIETWGLPLSEAQHNGLFVLCSDLPYAHETMRGYKFVDFFDPLDASELASQMRLFTLGNYPVREVEEPKVGKESDWAALFDLILEGD